MDDHTLRSYNAQLELYGPNEFALQKRLSKVFNHCYTNIEDILAGLTGAVI